MRTLLIGLVLSGLIAVAAAQTPALRFDVVSVKRNTSNVDGSSLRPEPTGITAVNILPMRLVRAAYQVADFQIVDAPGWFLSERYDVAARITEPVTIVELGSMLRTLLAERFGLRVAQRQREMPVLELQLERDGRTRLASSQQPCSLVQAKDAPIAAPASRTTPPCFSSIAGSVVARGVTSDMLAQELTRRLERFVVNRTGLTGVYDFDLQWTPDGNPVDAAPTDLPPLVTAVREQLGLRLVSARAPVDVYVIEAASRPLPD